MTEITNPYQAVIADMKKKRDELDKAINLLEQFAGNGTGPAGGAPGEIREDSFFGMTIPEATAKYLEMVGKPKSMQEIAGALLKGGFETRAANFPATVQTILRRTTNNDADATLLRVSGKIALRQWYKDRGGVRRSGSVEKAISDVASGKKSAEAAANDLLNEEDTQEDENAKSDVSQDDESEPS